MVVISEDDVICRSCGILVNTLDRLETEMRKTRDHVLRFLEQKYSLEDGELRGDKPKPCQPPQITRSMMKEIFCSKPRNEGDSNPGDSKRILKKAHSWLQCDRCKYTIRLNSFMMHHFGDHIKQRLFSDSYGQCSSENQQDKRHSCNKADDLGEWDRLNTIELRKWEKWCIVPSFFHGYWYYWHVTDNSGVTIKSDVVEILLKQAQSCLLLKQDYCHQGFIKLRSFVSSWYLTLSVISKFLLRWKVIPRFLGNQYVPQSINMANIWDSKKKIRLKFCTGNGNKKQGQDKKQTERGWKSAKSR